MTTRLLRPTDREDIAQRLLRSSAKASYDPLTEIDWADAAGREQLRHPAASRFPVRHPAVGSAHRGSAQGTQPA